MVDRGVYSALEVFRKGPDPATTLDRFEKYVKRADLVFATAVTTIDNDKKKLSFLQIWGGEEMITLLEQEGKVTSTDSFEAAVQKVETALRKHVNDVYPIYKLFCEMQQGKQTFVEWYPKVYEQAKMCDFTEYSAERAARDAMTIQTSDNKLRKKALTEAPTYAQFIKAGIAMESSKAQAEKMEEKTVDERVNYVDKQKRYSKKRLDTVRSKPPLGNKASEHRECDFCSYDPRTSHKKGKCPAKGKRCNQCKKKHHFAHAKVCPVNNVYDLSEEESEDGSESSEDEIGRIETVSHISEKEKSENYVEIEINGKQMKMKADSGCSKVLIPEKEFHRIRKTTRLAVTKVK